VSLFDHRFWGLAGAESGNPGGLYNCGTGQARSWLDLVNAVFAAMGKEPEIECIYQ
jgi:ADP-L-glycero-D-manno-heptose 6-epimerase